MHQNAVIGIQRHHVGDGVDDAGRAVPAENYEGSLKSQDGMALSTWRGIDLAPGGSVPIAVRFRPPAGGSYLDTLRIATSPCDTVLLVGIGGDEACPGTDQADRLRDLLVVRRRRRRPRCQRALADRQRRVRHHEIRVDLHLRAEAGAALTRAVRGVEREDPRLELGHRGPARQARELLREDQRAGRLARPLLPGALRNKIPARVPHAGDWPATDRRRRHQLITRAVHRQSPRASACGHATERPPTRLRRARSSRHLDGTPDPAPSPCRR